jgi:hypothetical protein
MISHHHCNHSAFPCLGKLRNVSTVLVPLGVDLSAQASPCSRSATISPFGQERFGRDAGRVGNRGCREDLSALARMDRYGKTRERAEPLNVGELAQLPKCDRGDGAKVGTTETTNPAFESATPSGLIQRCWQIGSNCKRPVPSRLPDSSIPCARKPQRLSNALGRFGGIGPGRVQEEAKRRGAAV